MEINRKWTKKEIRVSALRHAWTAITERAIEFENEGQMDMYEAMMAISSPLFREWENRARTLVPNHPERYEWNVRNVTKMVADSLVQAEESKMNDRGKA